MPGEIFTPGCPNHISSPSVLESAALKGPGHPMEKKHFAFRHTDGSQACPPACPQRTGSTLLAHPLQCSQSCNMSQVMLPLVIAERFILDAVNAGRELAVPLAAASSEGAEVSLPGHVL